MNCPGEVIESYYESDSFDFLKRNMPIIIQIKLENYEEFIRKFLKPFDKLFINSIQDTLKHLCENVPECVFGYATAYSYTLVVIPSQDKQHVIGINYDIQRMATLAASMVTLQFNRIFEKKAKTYVLNGTNFDQTFKLNAMQGYVSSIDKGASFSARCFNISKEGIYEYIHQQQKNCIENGIYEMGKTYLTEKELKENSSGRVQFMVFEKEKINFDNYPTDYKRGTACYRKKAGQEESEVSSGRNVDWIVDKNMPMLKKENEEFIEQFL